MPALPTLQSFIHKQPLNTFMTVLPVSAFLAYSVTALLPKQQTEHVWVVVGGRGRQQRSAHFLCFSRFSSAFPWVKSKGWIIAGSITAQKKQTSLFKQWQLYEARLCEPKSWCYHQTCLSSQSLQVTAAGSRSSTVPFCMSSLLNQSFK